jgi:hypothetical protein
MFEFMSQDMNKNILAKREILVNLPFVFLCDGAYAVVSQEEKKKELLAIVEDMSKKKAEHVRLYGSDAPSVVSLAQILVVYFLLFLLCAVAYAVVSQEKYEQFMEKMESGVFSSLLFFLYACC